LHGVVGHIMVREFGRETGAYEPGITLSKGHVQRRGEAQHQVATRLSAPGFDE
jgi:hypothetical protein